MSNSIYYNPNKLLSYNKLMNAVIGARGFGKSYAFKKYPINRFIKKGEQFIYVRRYKSELKKVGTYFDDVHPEFRNHSLIVKGRTFIIDDEVAGYAIPLSTWQSEKSNAYPNVTTIIFDEFIRQKDKSGYLPNEVEAFLNLVDTVIRTRDNVRIILLSNATTVVNPYFLYFGITPDTNKRFTSKGEIIVEIANSTDFMDFRKETAFGRLITGTEYANMAVKNEFTEDTDVFIEKRSKRSKFKFNITYEGKVYGIWLDVPSGLMYVSTAHDPSSKYSYVLSKDEMDEGSIYMRGYRQSYHLTNLVDFFKLGALRFDNQIVKTKMYEMMQKMSIY